MVSDYIIGGLIIFAIVVAFVVSLFVPISIGVNITFTSQAAIEIKMHTIKHNHITVLKMFFISFLLF